MNRWKEAGNCLIEGASKESGIVRGHGRRCEGAAAGRHREEVAGGPPRRILRRSQPRRQRQRAASAQLHGDGRRARLPRRARPRGLLAPRARPAHRRGGEVARRGDRGGGGQRVLGGGVHGGGRAHGHRPLQPVLLLARPSQRGGRDGGASGEPEGEADGRGGGGAQERVRRAGSNREAVDDTCLANQEQQKQQALNQYFLSPLRKARENDGRRQTSACGRPLRLAVCPSPQFRRAAAAASVEELGPRAARAGIRDSG